MSVSAVQRGMKSVLKAAGIEKERLCPYLAPQLCNRDLLLNGVDLRHIQEYRGHAKVEQAMVYIHVVKKMRNPAVGPLDMQGHMIKWAPSVLFFLFFAELFSFFIVFR